MKQFMQFRALNTYIRYCRSHVDFRRYSVVAVHSYRYSSTYSSNREHNTPASIIRKKVEKREPGALDIVDEKTDPYKILETLKSAVHTRDVLNVINTHLNHIAVEQYSEVYNTLFSLQKNNKSMSNEELVKSSEFRNLCDSLKKCVRHLKTSDAVNIFKVLTYLGVQPNTVLSQMLLQMIAKSVNDLHLREVVFLDFILRDLPAVPLVEALRIALPIVFESQVRIRLNKDNPAVLLDCFRYSVYKKLQGTTTISYIVDPLLQLKEKLTCKQAYLIASNFCQLTRMRYSWRNLYHYCMEKVANEMSSLTTGDILSLLTIVIRNYKWAAGYFYNEEYLSAVSEYVRKNYLPLEVVSEVLKQYNRVAYVDMELLEYADKLLRKERTRLNLEICTNAVNAFSNADYVPQRWDQYKRNVAQVFIESEKKTDFPWMSICASLMCLDCWQDELIQYAFSDEYMTAFCHKPGEGLSNRQIMMVVYQGAYLLFPHQYRLTPPPSDIVETAVKSMQQDLEDFPLLGALRHCYGGPTYVLSGVLSKYGHFIDHVIAVKDALPLPINTDYTDDTRTNSRVFLHDLQLPEGTIIYAIMLLDPVCYAINMERMRGFIVLRNRSLEKLGPKVYCISHMLWNRLPDVEKINYLKRELDIRSVECKEQLNTKEENVPLEVTADLLKQ